MQPEKKPAFHPVDLARPALLAACRTAQAAVRVVYRNENTPYGGHERYGFLNVHTVTDADVARDIKKQESLLKGLGFIRKVLIPFIGPSAMIVNDGDIWRQKRAQVRRHFKLAAARQNAIPLALKEADKEISSWLATSDAVDVEESMRRISSRSLMRGMMGDAITESEMDEITALAGTSAESRRNPTVISLGSRVVGCPVDHIKPIPQHMLDLKDRVFEIFGTVYDRRLKDRNPPDDLLQELIHLEDPTTNETMTRDAVLGELLQYVIGGSETTTTGMTMAYHHVLNDPETQQAMLNQIDEVVGNRPIEVEDIKNLTIAHNVMQETLRMTSPIYVIAVEINNPGGFLEAQDHRFGHGDVIIINIEKIHMDPETWGNDVHQFNPARFDGKNPRRDRASLWFGSGPRTCPGRPEAEEKIVGVLAESFRRARFEVKEDITGLKMDFSYRPEGNLKVVAKPRLRVA